MAGDLLHLFRRRLIYQGPCLSVTLIQIPYSTYRSWSQLSQAADAVREGPYSVRMAVKFTRHDRLTGKVMYDGQWSTKMEQRWGLLSWLCFFKVCKVKATATGAGIYRRWLATKGTQLGSVMPGGSFSGAAVLISPFTQPPHMPVVGRVLCKYFDLLEHTLKLLGKPSS